MPKPSDKDQMVFYVDPQLKRRFKAACSEDGLFMGGQLERLMMDWLRERERKRGEGKR